MPFKIIRHEISTRKTEAAVRPYDFSLELLRRKGISGFETWSVEAVFPISRETDGDVGYADCMLECLKKAKLQGIKSIEVFTPDPEKTGYEKETFLRGAIEGIREFLTEEELEICLVEGPEHRTDYGRNLKQAIREYLKKNLRSDDRSVQMRDVPFLSIFPMKKQEDPSSNGRRSTFRKTGGKASLFTESESVSCREDRYSDDRDEGADDNVDDYVDNYEACVSEAVCDDYEDKLKERMLHLADTFSEYLLYLIESRGMDNAEVYKRALVDKKVFSKIKNNPDYHPTKLTALCLCIGTKLNLDETRDLLARAGYALSPCDKMDVIFQFFIENEIYDMIELDIQLEEFGLPCIIA